jgi:hypothetical protein
MAPPASGGSIFRPEALRRHGEGRDRTVLPRLVSPRALVALWALAGLLLAGAAAAVLVLGPEAAGLRLGPGA